MRSVDHLTVERDSAGIGIFGEGLNNAARPGEFIFADCEKAIDNRDLGRMNRHLGDKSDPPRGGTLGGETGLVLEIGVDVSIGATPASAAANRHNERASR